MNHSGNMTIMMYCPKCGAPMRRSKSIIHITDRPELCDEFTIKHAPLIKEITLTCINRSCGNTIRRHPGFYEPNIYE